MYKERTVANVLRIIFTIFMVFVMLYCSSVMAIRFTVFSKVFWKKVVFNDQVRSSLADVALDKYKDEKWFTDDMQDMSENIVSFYIDEIMDATFDTNYELDEDKVIDLFDDDIVPILKAEGVSKSEIESARKDFIKDTKEGMDEYAGAVETASVKETFATIRLYSDSHIIFCVIVCAAMTIGLFFAHRNKFRAFKALGLSMVISNAIVFVLDLGFWGLIFLALEEAAKEEGLDEMGVELLNALVKDAFVFSLIIIGGALVFGIALLIVSSILAKKKAAKLAEID
ncbi:MAG: hypothetical protein J6U54_11970, partial [Clostridiales bacterium]|nr:hypothetical protein [Clostridiales bacterium]